MAEAILRGPDLTATNTIWTAPEFFYADTISMSFMDDYDETILSIPSGDKSVNSCIVPTSLMEEQDISLGDTVRVAINSVYTNPEDNRRIFYHFDLLVVGSYKKQGAEDTIYAPLSLFFDTRLIWGEGRATVGAPSSTFDTGYLVTAEQKEQLQITTFNSANFTISDSRQLTAFKNYLTDYGYSQVQKVSRVREFIVLKDAAFNNAIASIQQQIRYINTLYPFLYVLVGIIAIIVSYLLVVSRKKEFAIMRGLGATRLRTFLSFFYEQFILCLSGTAIGLLIWRTIWGQPSASHLMLTAGFILCYFLGSAISIMIMNFTNVLTILLDKD